MNNVKIRLIRQQDLEQLADIYMRAFNPVTDENWTLENAEKFMNFWLKMQPDLFYMAETDSQIVGGAVGMIKPFNNGPNLVDTEIFVDPKFQNQGIGKKLLQTLIQEAIRKYQVTTFAGIADGSAKFPMGWYNKIGIKKTNWVYIEGPAKEILKNLS